MPIQPQHSIKVFDRKRVKTLRARSAANLDKHDFLFEWVANNLDGRLADITRQFPTTLMIGGRLNKDHKALLIDRAKIKQLIIMELGAELLQGKHDLNVQGDEEMLPFGINTLDMVISPLSLHSVNDLPGALIQINHALKPDGLFLAALFGGETLFELRECMMQAEIITTGGVSPRISPFADKQQLGSLMQRAGFALPVIDSEHISVSYPNLKKLLHDLRGMGEGNAIIERSRRPATKALFEKTEQEYQKRFSDEQGKIQASFEIIFLTGWAPHSSQQQPLRPGSAESRLASALDTDEISVKR